MSLYRETPVVTPVEPKQPPVVTPVDEELPGLAGGDKDMSEYMLSFMFGSIVIVAMVVCIIIAASSRGKKEHFIERALIGGASTKLVTNTDTVINKPTTTIADYSNVVAKNTDTTVNVMPPITKVQYTTAIKKVRDLQKYADILKKTLNIEHALIGAAVNNTTVTNVVPATASPNQIKVLAVEMSKLSDDLENIAEILSPTE